VTGDATGAPIIDTHCHLDPQYHPDGPDAALERAREAGVVGFVAIGVGSDLSAARNAIAVAGRRDDTWAVVGIHPHDAISGDEATLAELEQLARSPHVVAIGEIGLDYHYMHSPKSEQDRTFRACVRMARRLKKPIVIHTREAPDDTLRILEEEGAGEVGGVIHCFSEDRPFAARALDLGFDLSFSGIVTFKSAKAVQEVAAWAPADRILVETDSPYLAPIPLRGKTNEPSYVVHTVRRVAELRGVTVDELCRLTTANAERRFQLSRS
jgi:TatD DNase family protein